MSRPSRVSTWSNVARLALNGRRSTSAPQTSPRKVVKSRASTSASAGANDAKRSSAWRVSALDHVRYSTRWRLRASAAQQDLAVLGDGVLDEVDLLVRPRRAGDVLVQVVGRRQRQVVVETARPQRGVVVVMPDVPHQDGAFRQVEGPGGRTAARRPPQVVLHPVVAAQRRPTPAAVRVPAPLDYRRPAVRGEMLEHDAQPLVEVCPLAQAIGDLRMHPESVPQVPELQIGGVGRRVGPESRARRTARSGRRSIIDLGETEERRLRLLAERVGDLPALGGRQHETAVARAAGIQAEHPPRRTGHVTQVDVEAAGQLLDGLPAVDHACPVSAVVHAGMVPRMFFFRPTPGSRAADARAARSPVGTGDDGRRRPAAHGGCPGRRPRPVRNRRRRARTSGGAGKPEHPARPQLTMAL